MIFALVILAILFIAFNLVIMFACLIQASDDDDAMDRYELKMQKEREAKQNEKDAENANTSIKIVIDEDDKKS